MLVIGSFHGDEDEGHEIVARLRDESPNTFAIWLVETVNPDGIAAEPAKERARRRPQPQLLRRLEGELGHLERLLPGP